jgi:hypothetical protein
MLTAMLVRINGPLLKRMKKDAVEHGVSIQDYTAVCFEQFLSHPIDARRNKFSRISKKTAGRTIKL